MLARIHFPRKGKMQLVEAVGCLICSESAAAQ